MSVAGDAAIVSVFVRVSVEDAFEVFTQEIDLWWKQGPKFRIAGKRRGTLMLEPKLGGKLFESFDQHGAPRTFEVGHVAHWQPPHALTLEWRGVNFKPHEKTWVEVSFTPLGEGTIVRVCHRGWAVLPPEHPARHGQQGAEFSRFLGLWWGELMTSLREHVAERAAGAAH